VRMRIAAIAAPAVLAALAASAVACSARDEPAAPSGTTTAAAAAPRSATTTAAPTTTAANQVISATVAGGKVTPPPAPVEVKLGSTVVIEVTADVADEIHVHGYDKSQVLAPGKPGRLELAATIPGQFEVELESAHLLLFTLRVS